tara:strand:- start:3855 stop:4310 length:456 start_codon:yes stop_codon:yes gene_type:complete
MSILEFEITVKCPQVESDDSQTRGAIKINGEQHAKIELNGAEEKVIKFNADLEDGEHTIEITHDFSADNISALVIEKIIMDEIDIGVISYGGTYTPTYPEPWYSDEVDAGRTPKEIIGKGVDGSAPLFMGWEGSYKLEFTTPLYEWLLENI